MYCILFRISTIKGGRKLPPAEYNFSLGWKE
jgi:hypothetical protein